MTPTHTDASTGEVIDVAKETQKKDKKAPPIMRVKVYSPFKVYVDQDAHSLSGVNATGPFDILPHHHNFMALLTPSELTVRPVSGGEQKIRISGGLMHVKADKVIIFLDI
jgi:F0F1-type ATP synthase epsilon subunit